MDHQADRNVQDRAPEKRQYDSDAYALWTARCCDATRTNCLGVPSQAAELNASSERRRLQEGKQGVKGLPMWLRKVTQHVIQPL